MSHVASVELQITNLDALEQAAEACGLELIRESKTFSWFGRFLNDWSNEQRAAALKGYDPKQFGHCEHELRLKGSRRGDGNYSIGLVPRLDGKPGWELLYDTYGQGHKLEAAAGVNLNGLRDQYAAALAERKCKAMGYKVKRRVTQDGDIQVVAVKA